MKPHYLALSGGVGGAKLAAGLAAALPPSALTVAVNVGDDFEHLGLTICPDLDTVLYTLSGVVHRGQGWGRGDESWGVLDELRRLGGDDWFSLGDRDIALHLLRRQRLDAGMSLSAVAAELSTKLGVRPCVRPVTDQRLRTEVETDAGLLPFQDYFVRLRCEPVLQSLNFVGAEDAVLAPDVRAALDDPALAGIILCPSNPYLSIAPMLAVAELRSRLQSADVPVIAIAPIVAGQALKGPTAKIMRELNVEPAAEVIGTLYGDFVDLIVLDHADAARVQGDPRFVAAATVMRSHDDRLALARRCIELIDETRD